MHVPDFVAYGEGYTAWVHASSPALAGLERWGTELATRERRIGIGALVAAARAVFPTVVAAAGDDFENIAVTGTELSGTGEFEVDGGPVELQLARAAAWLVDGDNAPISQAFDRTRQLYVWDDDLLPADDIRHYWILDVGQLCLAAILNGNDGDPAGGGYYEWPWQTCVGRGLVAVARAVGSIEPLVAAWR